MAASVSPLKLKGKNKLFTNSKDLNCCHDNRTSVRLLERRNRKSNVLGCCVVVVCFFTFCVCALLLCGVGWCYYVFVFCCIDSCLWFFLHQCLFVSPFVVCECIVVAVVVVCVCVGLVLYVSFVCVCKCCVVQSLCVVVCELLLCCCCVFLFSLTKRLPVFLLLQFNVARGLFWKVKREHLNWKKLNVLSHLDCLSTRQFPLKNLENTRRKNWQV